MYNIHLENVENKHEYEELAKVFLAPEEFAIFFHSDELPEDVKTFTYKGDKNLLKQELFHALQRHTGKRPKWGIVTGIRPVKLTGEIINRLGSVEKAGKHLEEYYLVHPDKVKLLLEIWGYQKKRLSHPEPNSAGIYIGIPFCPTRCLYCSFTSNQVKEPEIQRYLQALYQEIDFVKDEMDKVGLYSETIYIGGGTPTTLSAKQLDELFDYIKGLFSPKLAEITVEAGRPDTITTEKLSVLKNNYVNRISINPQTMKDETLKFIGRDHDIPSVKNAYLMARDAAIPTVNMDLIVGLPGETPEDFKYTLNEILALKPENITVHTLAVKRSSRLKDMDEHYHYRQEELVEQMLEYAGETLRENGYRPYYLYRQKHTAGNTENIGYCKDDALGIYNIRIMEEAQSIIAMGAGGMTKVYYPEENRLERVPNVSNYEIYIERIDEMLMRKKENLFRR